MAKKSTMIKTVPIVLAVTLFTILIIYLGLSVYKKLNSDELGLKYDNIAKHLDIAAKAEGLHLGPPGFSFIKFPSVFKTLWLQFITCLNRDGVIIELDVSYQYKANSNYMHQLVLQFKYFDGYKKVLSASGISAVHDTCALFTTTDFQTSRGRFQENLRENMRKYCEDLYCELNDLQVNNVQRPRLFESAVKDKEAAKENIRIAENERPRLILQAETEYEEARKQYEIIINRGTTQARIIKTRADIDSKIIKKKYLTDLNIYKQIKASQELDTEGLLSYLAVRIIADSKTEVNFAMKSPAKTSYRSITD